jgi:predicted HNH restriction endonuclease
MTYRNKSNKEYMREYRQRPEVIERLREQQKLYNQKTEHREKQKVRKQKLEYIQEQKRYRQKDEIKAMYKLKQRAYQQTAEYKEKANQKNKTLRIQALTVLGAKCSVCGNDDHRVLQIDHLLPLAGDKRIQLTTLCRSIIAGNTNNLQLLCANCHAIKTWHT